MSMLLLPNEVLSMTAQAARRLVEAGDGDCALLYLALLQGGSDPDRAAAQLGWDTPRLSAAFSRLTSLGLAQGSCPSPAPASTQPALVDDRPPEYTRGDIADALEQEHSFRGLYREMERLLGKVFSDTDLKSLYTIYDYLALPVEVIFMLGGYVVRMSRRQRGPDAPPPRMTEVKKEALAGHHHRGAGGGIPAPTGGHRPAGVGGALRRGRHPETARHRPGAGVHHPLGPVGLLR